MGTEVAAGCGGTRITREKSVGAASAADDPAGLDAGMVRLAVWEFGIGAVVSGAVVFGTRSSPALPATSSRLRFLEVLRRAAGCSALRTRGVPGRDVERRAQRVLRLCPCRCGRMAAVAVVGRRRAEADHRRVPELLDDSFGRNWRRPRSWPWAATGVGVRLHLHRGRPGIQSGRHRLNRHLSSTPPRTPAIRVETSERFRPSR